MNINEESLKDTILELESSFNEINKLKFTLIDTSLSQFDYLFEKDSHGELLYKSLPINNIEEIYNTFDIDLIPLCEEFEYNKGIEKIEKMKKLLAESLAL